MAGEAIIIVRIDRDLTEKVAKRLSDLKINRSNAIRMFMAEIIRDDTLLYEMDIIKEAKYYLWSGDTVQLSFKVDSSLKAACEAKLSCIYNTDLKTVITAFYAQIAKSEEAPFGVVQLMSTPIRACREVISIDGKLMKEFNEVVQDMGITMKDAITEFMREAVNRRRELWGLKDLELFNSRIVYNLVGPWRPMIDVTRSVEK